jgi:hypothetical protein
MSRLLPVRLAETPRLVGRSRGCKNALQHILAFQQAFSRQVSAPVSLDFAQVPDGDIDRSPRINRQIDLTFGLSATQPDDFSTQRRTPRISRQDAGWLPKQWLR